MKLKIALSASFYNVKAVQALLHTCDRIYTTQFRNLREICDLFGDEKVRALPDGCQTTVEWIKARETENAKYGDHEVEFITFGDLLKISRVTDERLKIALEELQDQLTLVEALRKEMLELQEDQRRLNYLATLGQYEHHAGPINTWSVTGSGKQTLRDVLDRMRAGLQYGPDNKPIISTGYNRVPTAPMALSHSLAAVLAQPAPRDPLAQDHSPEPQSDLAKQWDGHGG